MSETPKRKSLVAPKRKIKVKKRKPQKKHASYTNRPRKVKKTKNPIIWFFRAVLKLFRLIISSVVFVSVLVLMGAVLYYYTQLPDPSELMDKREHGSVTMLDYNGKVFAWRGDQFGGLVTPDTVSRHLKNAVIATEDKRFYKHFGISIHGIAGAIRTNMKEGRSPLSGHGGSTITQQVAKNAFFFDLPSKLRKLKEVPMAFAMELKYTKDEILAMYLNRAYLGAGSNGFEAASQRYFGKSVKIVSPSEAAMLAGLLKAPSRYAPTRNLNRSHIRASLILGLMYDQGYLTKAELDEARNNPAQLSAVARKKAGGYFADWIMQSAPDFIIKGTTEDIIIHTTFDETIQRATEDSLKSVFDRKLKSGSKVQAAIVVLSRDGAVRAMVGGRNTGKQGSFNRATQALRQSGSAFKPFVYAAALEFGMQYNSIVIDEPISIKIPGKAPYKPRNYIRNSYLGPITLTTALAKSVNTVAVRLSEEIGRRRVRAVANDFGIHQKLALGPALALGVSETTLLEMTGAYAGILNGGRQTIPYGLTALTIQGDNEPLLGKIGGLGIRVINEGAAKQLIYMMNQVIENGTGKRAKLKDREVAGKTGTTQGARDAWFVGFSADYIVGVWMGMDNNTKLKGVTGGGMTAEIWREVMTRIHVDMPVRKLPMFRPAFEFDPIKEDQFLPVEKNTQKGKQLSIEKQIIRDIKRNKINLGGFVDSVLENLFGKKK